MSGFLYFAPGFDKVPEDGALVGLGLAHLVGASMVGFEVGLGADAAGMAKQELGPERGGEVRGFLFGAREGFRLEEIRFDPAQEWRWLPSGAGVGVWVGRGPRPVDLIRASVVEGTVVKLGDGQKWLVPVAHAYVVDQTGNCVGRTVKLPTRSRLNYATMEFEPGGIAPAYQVLWEIAMRWLGELGNAGGLTTKGTKGHEGHEGGEEGGDAGFVFNFAGGHEAAVTVLGANYRVGLAEADLLGLLSEEVVKQVMWALCGAEPLEAGVKKKLRCETASS